MENLYQKNVQRRQARLALAALIAPLAFVLFRFWRSDLLNWHMSRYFLESDWYRLSLWPWLSGWNPLGFGGHPQGYFSPSLFQWLAGGLGRLVGTARAVRILVSASVLLLPISIYLYLSDLGFSTEEKFGGIFVALASLFLFSHAAFLGGTFSAAFVGGKFPEFWALPFVFFYLWALRKGVKRLSYLLLASAFFAIIVLTDGPTAKIALCLSLMYGAVYFYYMNRHKLLDYIIHLIIVASLSVAWFGPRLLFASFAGRLNILQMGPFFFATGIGTVLLLWWFGSIMAALHFGRRWPERLMVILFSLTDLVAVYLLSLVFPALPNYSLVPLLYCFAGFIAVSFAISVPKKKWALPLAGAIFVVASVYFGVREFRFKRRVLTVASFPFTHSRGLVDENRASPFYTRFENPYQLTAGLLHAGHDLLNGLDWESSSTAPYIYSFLKELDGNSDDHALVMPADHSAPQIEAHALLLGPKWIMTTSPIDAKIFSKALSMPALGGQITFSANGEKWPPLAPKIYILQNSVATVAAARPVPVPQNWRSYVDSWWGGANIEAIPIEAVDAPQDFTPPEKTDAVLFTPAGPEKFTVDVLTRKPKWIYIKVPYFPDWKVFQAGENVPVYRAGPDMMMIHGKGPYLMAYRRSKAEVLFQLYSLIAWVILIPFMAFEFATARPARERPTKKLTPS